MNAVDFAAWAEPDLTITLGDHTYNVRPPSVADAAKLLALAVLLEVQLGLAEGPVPDEVTDLLRGIGADEHPALRDVYPQMVADGISQGTIDRAAVFATFVWARGREWADAMATLMWTKVDEGAGAAAPKG